MIVFASWCGTIVYMKISIICYSLTGHTEEMAEEIVKGIEKEGLEAAVFNIRDNAVDNEYLASSEGGFAKSVGSEAFIEGFWKTAALSL